MSLTNDIKVIQIQSSNNKINVPSSSLKQLYGTWVMNWIPHKALSHFGDQFYENNYILELYYISR